jgi:hypothetical protein
MKKYAKNLLKTCSEQAREQKPVDVDVKSNEESENWFCA